MKDRLIRTGGTVLMVARTLIPFLPLAGQETGDGSVLLVVPRVSERVRVDGRVNDPAWEEALRLPVALHQPVYLGVPTEGTEFRVAHDGEYLYFSCRALDSEPTQIRNPSLERDESSFSNDWCLLGLDTFSDRETLLVFGTTPAGLRTDAVFPNDGGTGPNFSWHAFWDVEVSRDEGGWYAEFRIPFSSLRFQESGGSVAMGIIATRVIARKNEIHTFPAISPRWGRTSFFKASQSQEIVLTSIRSGGPVYLTPYGVAGGGANHALSPDGDVYSREVDRVTEVGSDLKVGLTENLTLDLSLNTDFAQVEADDQQVNLTRYSLFFPEKRVFFQERSSVFEFSLGGNERLFHSRRVGLSQGRPRRIYGGARVVGRVGEWDVGALSLQTEAPVANGASENASVFRLRRRVLNENSYVGGILTSRLGNSGTRNLLIGWDGVLRLFGQDYLTINLAQSHHPDAVQKEGLLDGAFMRLFWQRRGVDGLVYEVDLARAGEDFEPGLGFLFRQDFSRAETGAGYGWRGDESSPLLRYDLSVGWDGLWRGADGSAETAVLTSQVEVEWKSGHLFTAQVTSTSEDLQSPFHLSEEVLVPKGEHRFTVGSLSFRQSLGSLLRTNATVRYGGYYDGRRASASVTSTWNPSRHLELEGTYQVEDLDFSHRAEHFRAHIGRLRVEGRANIRLSSAALVQYSSETHGLSGNLRFRFNPREGNDLYIVVNGNLVVEPDAFDPVRPVLDRWALLVKYSRTLVLEF